MPSATRAPCFYSKLTRNIFTKAHTLPASVHSGAATCLCAVSAALHQSHTPCVYAQTLAHLALPRRRPRPARSCTTLTSAACCFFPRAAKPMTQTSTFVVLAALQGAHHIIVTLVPPADIQRASLTMQQIPHLAMASSSALQPEHVGTTASTNC